MDMIQLIAYLVLLSMIVKLVFLVFANVSKDIQDAKLSKQIKHSVKKSDQLVTVVIHETSGDLLIKDCLEAVAANTHSGLQIIIVADTAKSNMYRQARRYSKSHYEYDILVTTKGKSNSATHLLASISRKIKGTFILSIDSQMLLHQSAITDCLKTFDSNEKMSVFMLHNPVTNSLIQSSRSILFRLLQQLQIAFPNRPIVPMTQRPFLIQNSTHLKASTVNDSNKWFEAAAHASSSVNLQIGVSRDYSQSKMIPTSSQVKLLLALWIVTDGLSVWAANVIFGWQTAIIMIQITAMFYVMSIGLLIASDRNIKILHKFALVLLVPFAYIGQIVTLPLPLANKPRMN